MGLFNLLTTGQQQRLEEHDVDDQQQHDFKTRFDLKRSDTTEQALKVGQELTNQSMAEAANAAAAAARSEIPSLSPPSFPSQREEQGKRSSLLSQSTSTNEEDKGGDSNSSGDEDDDDDGQDDVDVEDLLWGAQMDLIGHRHPQAVAKLQQAVKQSSSAACATLGNLLARGLRGEHLSHTNNRSPLSSPTNDGISPPKHRHHNYHHNANHNHHHHHLNSTSLSPKGSVASNSRPAPPSRGLSHAIPASQNEDALAAAQLFLVGLEIELNKAVEPSQPVSNGKTRLRNVHDDRYDGGLSEDESAEGRYFSLERALDLTVGLTDSYRFGVVCPPQDYDSTVSDSAKEIWAKGARLAERALKHPALAMPPPLVQSLSLPDATASTSSTSRSRSVNRSYNHPSTTLPPPNAHPHLSLKTKLRITILVHLMYLLALQSWTTDRDRAEEYWKEIIRVGTTATGGVGIKEGDEVVDRARRRVAGIHRTEGPQEDWHLAKSKNKRGRTTASTAGEERPRASTVSGQRPEKPNKRGDAVLEMRREAEEAAKAKTAEEQSNDALACSNGGGEPSSLSSAITIKGMTSPRIGHSLHHNEFSSSRIGSPSTSKQDAASPSLSTSLGGGGRTPKPSKFHFAADISNDYPSPPDTPDSSPTIGTDAPRQPARHEYDSSYTNTPETTEPETYFPQDPSAASTTPTEPSLADSIQSLPSRQPSSSPARHRALPNGKASRGQGRRRVISIGAASVVSTASIPSWNAPDRLLARVGSSASVCTLPPDFGSSAKGKSRAIDSTQLTNGVQASFVLPHRRSPTSASTNDLPSTTNTSSKGQGASRWRWSSLKAQSSRLLGTVSNQRTRSSDVSAMGSLQRALRKDDELVASSNYWGALEEENEETEHESGIEGGEEEDQNIEGHEGNVLASGILPPQALAINQDGELVIGHAHIFERTPMARTDISSVAAEIDPKAVNGVTSLPPKPSNPDIRIVDGSSSAKQPSPTKKSDHPPHRIRSNKAANRSFVDVTSAATDDYPTSRPRLSRQSSAAANGSTKPLSPEQGGQGRPSALVAPKFGRLEHRSVSFPNIGGADHKSGASGDQMDPVLLELERQSRVGVRTVCAACGKKGLNFPTSRGGQTYCSRDCRIVGQASRTATPSPASAVSITESS